MITITPSEIVKLLWKERFFESEKPFREIQVAASKRGLNPEYSLLHNALRRVKYLTRRGFRGNYRYIQAFNPDDGRVKSDFNALKGIYLLKERGIHPRILEASGKLYVDGHYALAIFEAFKVVNNMVKEKSGLSNLDGKDLMAQAFSLKSPKLRWSSLTTASERNEQEGFMFLFMGAVVGVRNPKAHDVTILKDQTKTLEYLSFASLLAKRVDEAKIAIK